MRLKEIEKRLAELDAIVESATTEEAINAAVEERQQLMEEKAKIEALEQRRTGQGAAEQQGRWRCCRGRQRQGERDQKLQRVHRRVCRIR